MTHVLAPSDPRLVAALVKAYVAALDQLLTDLALLRGERALRTARGRNQSPAFEVRR